MAINRVSTASLYQQNLSDISSVQVELAKLNKQISSGYKANSWDELNGSVERVSAYQTKIDSISTYNSNNTSVMARLNVMDHTMGQLQDIATQYASLISQRNSGVGGNSLNFATQAKAMLDQISQDMNVQIAGRYVFSGSKTNTAPVNQPIGISGSSGTPSNSYYNGSSDALTARISDAQVLHYGVPGDDPAFQNLISAITTGIAGNASNDSSLLSKSIDNINLAIQGLADVKTGVDTSITNIQNVQDQHATLKLYWQQALSDETSTDVAEASIKLAADQTTLQATFQAFAGLTKLKLTDYL